MLNLQTLQQFDSKIDDELGYDDLYDIRAWIDRILYNQNWLHFSLVINKVEKLLFLFSFMDLFA